MEKQQTQNDRVKQLIKAIGAKGQRKNAEVIYGVYDSSRQSLSTRINDWFIDHSKVPLEEKTYFFHLLAVMVDAGIPVIQALKILAARTQNEHFRRVLNTVVFTVIQGKKLSEAMARFPDVFGDMEVGVVRAGEAAGNLEKMLLRVSEQLEKTHELQMKITTASIYPLAVMMVLLVVAAGMLMFVIPSLVSILREGGLKDSDFPLATQILLGISNFVAYYWWAAIIGALLLYMVLKVYIGSDTGRLRWDLFKLKMPVVGTLLRRMYVLRFVSTLGILMEAGLPVVNALTIIATSLRSEIYRLKVWELISEVQQGQKISAGLADAPFLFPDTVTQMLSVAEQSASMGSISQKIGVQYDREIDNALKRLTSLFEPIMIVMVGVFVALLALAILTPVFKLTQLVSKGDA
ncbi:type II secretion system F family protein [Candidatus Gracilibacteria bacterium]|nr:type II secretion system F family protein [Candidatus Gracilibacteria bacterium]